MARDLIINFRGSAAGRKTLKDLQHNTLLFAAALSGFLRRGMYKCLKKAGKVQVCLIVIVSKKRSDCWAVSYYALDIDCEIGI
jgi:hypothetical protein